MVNIPESTPLNICFISQTSPDQCVCLFFAFFFFAFFVFPSVNILCEEATSIKEIKENDSY